MTGLGLSQLLAFDRGGGIARAVYCPHQRVAVERDLRRDGRVQRLAAARCQARAMNNGH